MNKKTKVTIVVLIALVIIALSFYYYKTQTLEYIVEKTEKSVFLVRTFSDGQPLAQGSGFFIKLSEVSSDKILGITNLHVIEGADSIVITTNNKRDFTISNASFYADSADLFLFEWNIEDISMNKLEYLKIESDPLEKSQFVFSIGHPEGLEYSFSSGSISSIRGDFKNFDAIQTTAPISHGSSGSPLLSRRGRVLGVNSFSNVNGQNLNFAIQLNEKVFTKLIDWRNNSFGDLQLKLSFKKWLITAKDGKTRQTLKSVNPLKYVLEENYHFFDGAYWDRENNNQDDSLGKQTLELRLKGYLESDSVEENTFLYAIELLDEEYTYKFPPERIPRKYFERGVNLYKNPFMYFGLALYHLSDCNISLYIKTLKEAETAYAKWQEESGSVAISARERRLAFFKSTPEEWSDWDEKEVKSFYDFFLKKNLYTDEIGYEIFKVRWFGDIVKSKRSDNPVLLSHLAYGYFLDYKFNRNFNSLNEAKKYLKNLKSSRFQLNIQHTGEIYFFLNYLINQKLDCDAMSDGTWIDPRQLNEALTFTDDYGLIYGSKSLYDIGMQSKYFCR